MNVLVKREVAKWMLSPFQLASSLESFYKCCNASFTFIHCKRTPTANSAFLNLFQLDKLIWLFSKCDQIEGNDISAYWVRFRQMLIQQLMSQNSSLFIPHMYKHRRTSPRQSRIYWSSTGQKLHMFPYSLVAYIRSKFSLYPSNSVKDTSYTWC